MSNDYPITETEFRTWLEAQRDSVVGKTCISWSCPVRKCLGDLRGVIQADVVENATYFDKRSSIANPAWVEQFITRLDNSAQGMALEVTGAEALTFLDSSTETQGENDANGG